MPPKPDLSQLIDIGEGLSFKDDWNKRAEILGADEIATFGPESFKLVGEYFSYVVAKRIAELTDMQKQDRVLELGCGPGKIVYWLAEKAYSLDAVDVSDVMIHHAAERCKNKPNIALHVNNGQDLSGFESNSRDIVYSFACFIHLPIDIQEKYERELLRVLRPGGTCLIHVRHNQALTKNVRTYTGANYDQARIENLSKLPETASVEFMPIERCDDLVANLDHRRWVRIKKK